MLQHIINQVHKSLIKSAKTIAVAESCTGGLLSAMLTELSGSSKYFTLGVVTYSNKAKERILGIPSSVIAKNGAVSEIVAKLMAQKVRRLAKTDFGISITGIAGPAGCAEVHTGASFSAGCGTTRKPIGTVFIAIAAKNKTLCKQFRFRGTRRSIRNKSALEAVKLLNILVETRF
ncbi:MAG: nicotinamide-nucleotide amidohydrolase family protein [Candidatus Omnitrophica bacterium]|nr:nicotinamide-nucleotide amidohydrolase family protein [Candidatus Omnitrophota bacterium]